MNWNHTPSALNAELLEECCGDDPLVSNKAVRVQKSASKNGDHDDRETTTENLGAVSDERTTGHCTEVGHTDTIS